MPREVVAQVLVDGVPVQVRGVVAEAVVPGQFHHARLGLAGGDGRLRDAGQLHEHRFDLAQLDPVAADLHLLICPAQVDQARGIGSHEVTAAVRPLPAQGLQRPEFHGVLVRIQVARHPGTADDQLAHLPPPDRPLAARADHCHTPSIQGQPDPHRLTAGQPRRAGHHRGLGRTVGVPHLRAPLRQPVGQPARTCLAAHHQQADAVQRARRPQRGQRRHRRDHRHLPLLQPRDQLRPGLDDRAGGRHQACAMAPGQPHLLARGVESHRQACQDPVPGPERIAAQEQPGLGIDERRRTAVGHGHTLRGAGRAGREDDPRVILRHRAAGGGAGRPRRPPDQLAAADDGAHPRCGPHQFGPGVRVVLVDGYVRRPDRHDGEDGQVKLRGTGTDADAHPVTRAYARRGQPATDSPHLPKQALVVQHGPAIVDRGSSREPLRRGLQDLPQRARRRRRSSGVDRIRRHRLQAGVDKAGIELFRRHCISPSTLAGAAAIRMPAGSAAR